METDEILDLAYEQLRHLAASFLRRERFDHTLQPTAVVHEAYVRLSEQTGIDWRSQEHFVGVVARLMRQILVDHARMHNAEKRGGGQEPLTLTEARTLTDGRPLSLLALDEALQALGEVDPAKVELVELHFFGGLTFDEIAELRNLSRSTLMREWQKTRLWLYHELKGKPG
jgi:RNA polymerase sigma-70 factor (ECF subfamily)